MTIRVGINGFGRIGRYVFRAMEKDPDFEVVAINDLKACDQYSHLLKYDSVHGRAFDEVFPTGEGYDISVDGRVVKGLSERDPKKLGWGDLGVDIVIESTGKFKDAQEARAHIDDSGAKKVLITAPGKNEDFTCVYGVNSDQYDPAKHDIVSGASCTTNCLAPVTKVLLENFGIERGFINTIHAYTKDQNILDHKHKDLRRARAAAVNIIPTSTGAAKAIGKVFPELLGKMDGMATRVPTPDGSMVDLVAELGKAATIEQINAAMKEAAEGELKGILRYETDPIVSCDIIGTPAASIFDSLLTMVLGGEGNLVKVIAWYDNEAGYSMQMLRIAKMLAEG